MDRHRLSGLERAVREGVEALLDALCPRRCAGCGLDGSELCEACARGLERVSGTVCARCGRPVDQATGLRCRRDHSGLRGIAVARAPYRYRGTAGAIVRRLKFDRDHGAGRRLVRAMTQSIERWVRGPGRRARCVAVPLHRRKRRARGIDQASWLADAIARELDLEFVAGALRRARDTLPQGDPRVTSRAQNVRGAFAVRRAAAIRGRTVLLVDDVTTSGATARECARVLREAGALEVALLTAAFAR